MVFVGEEGYGVGGAPAGAGLHAWIDDGLKGVDYAANCALPNVDAWWVGEGVGAD